MKVLVYILENELRPCGGPLGYNYNLKRQLDLLKCNTIHYIESLNNPANGINDIINKIRISWIKNVLIILKSVFKKSYMLYGIKHKAMVDLNQYDIVHFHSAMDMYNSRDSLTDYNGAVVLTSHTPTLPSLEIFSMLTDFEKKHLRFLYRNLKKIDEYAFHRADYIIFPCEEAEEPYSNNWDDFKQFKGLNSAKFKYLLTGINACHASVSEIEIRRKYNIPLDAFVVCYCGRHSEIKGYDILKEIGEKFLEKHKNAYILVAGKEEPLKGLESDRWIEVGWTNDPYSIVNASNLFILPNRETYFDLIALEVLSLGKPMLITNTGGNKYFKKIDGIGIFYYDDILDALQQLDKIIEMKSEDLDRLGKNNKNVFKSKFTSSIFAQNYIKMIDGIYEDYSSKNKK